MSKNKANKSDQPHRTPPQPEQEQRDDDTVDEQITQKEDTEGGYVEEKQKKDKPADQSDDESGAPRAREAPPPPDAEADSASELRHERDELYGRLQRVSADFQNYVRRSRQSADEAVDLARGDLIKSLIPVLDHFDRALDVDPSQADAKGLHDGMRIVHDELLKVLEQSGVERIDTRAGEPFDPHRHEALMRQPAEGVAPNHIAAPLQPGYVYKGRTLRPAKVAVAPADGS